MIALRLPRNWLAGLLFAAAGQANAQHPPIDVGALVSNARLGVGYAQMIGLAATPDVSAASYEISSSDPKPKLDVLRVPYQARWLTLAPDADLYWTVAGGYLRFKDEFPVAATPPATGSIGSRWTAYSASGGLLAKIRIGDDLTLEPALDLALARLENSASYNGAASALQPLLDGPLFNWQTNAWLLTPSVGLAWAPPIDAGRINVRGHVARSWIRSFDESAALQSFSETANIYSIRVDYARPTSYRIADRALSWVAYGGYAGFFGASRNALGFSSAGEIGGGIEAPLDTDSANSERLRLGAGYLFGPDVRGWTIGLRMEF